ncbi:MAG: leucine-rich repeat protein [Oscillospiraceae bacterium]|nr:leucine-rich repeat protein [Oscillospiraceae bacterium]
MKKLFSFILALSLTLIFPLVAFAESEFTTADTLTVMRYMAGIAPLSEADLERYDVNKDGKVDSTDALMILRIAKGLPPMGILHIHLGSRNITGEQFIEMIENGEISVFVTTLEFHSNNITDLSIFEFERLIYLSSLNLSDNQISDLTPLTRMKRLNNLFLNNNQITDITSLSELTTLIGLGLSNNKISDITPLCELYRLEFLILDGNPIDEKQIDELQRYISHTKIHFK